MKRPRSIVFLIVGILIGGLLSGILFLIIGLISQNQLSLSNRSKVSVESVQIAPTQNRSASINNAGKININLADLSTLDGLPGIGKEKAQAIITFREKYGYFQELDELLYVPGIGVNLFNSILPQITLEEVN